MSAIPGTVTLVLAPWARPAIDDPRRAATMRKPRTVASAMFPSRCELGV
jgi:hypothetical protein